MRPLAAVVLAALALLSASCRKPDIHSREAVQEAVAKYVKAINKGDGQALVDIHSARQRQAFDAAFVKQGFPPRKGLEFKVEGVLLRNGTAGVFGRHVEDGKPAEDEQALLFVLEDGQWRLERQLGSNSPIHRPAFAPPEGGRFIAAGLPWANVPARDMAAADAGEFGYALQAVRDESFLYLRLAFANALPPPDSALPEPAAGMGRHMPNIDPGRLTIAEDGAQKPFSLSFDTTAVTHFRNGRNSYALGYSFTLHGHDGKAIFYSTAESEEKLLAVGEREIVARIPLESLGAGADTAYTIGVTRFDDKIEYRPARY